jgi:two-component system nitrate/nitrite response regulator NarL
VTLNVTLEGSKGKSVSHRRNKWAEEVEMRAQAFATVLVGQDPLVREGLVQILRRAGFHIAASVARLDEGVGIVPPQDRPLLLILDAGHDSHAEIGQVRCAKRDYAAARIAVLASYYQHANVVAAFRAGASCYLVRTMAAEALIKSLELVMLGETILPATFLSYAADEADVHRSEPTETVGEEALSLPLTVAADAPRLSVGEQRILRCLVQGDSNKAIALKINIAEATVKVHVKAILRKVRAHNRTQAAIWAINKGLLAAVDRDASLPLLAPTMPAVPELSTMELPADMPLPD